MRRPTMKRPNINRDNVARALARNFLKGCLVLVPSAVTLYVIYFIFTTVDGLVAVPIPGLGFLFTVTLITAVGYLASNVVGRQLFDAVERQLARVPLVNLVYTSLKDLVEAFVGEKKRFDRPVMVSVGLGEGAKLLGFITADALEALGLDDHVAVYFPQAYNFAGNLVLFPRDKVTPLEVDRSQFMAFIVSGGVVSTPEAAQRFSEPEV